MADRHRRTGKPRPASKDIRAQSHRRRRRRRRRGRGRLVEGPFAGDDDDAAAAATTAVDAAAAAAISAPVLLSHPKKPRDGMGRLAQGYGHGRKVLPWTGFRSGPVASVPVGSSRPLLRLVLLLLLSSCLNKLSRKAMLFFHDLHPSLVWVPSSSSSSSTSSCSFSPVVRYGPVPGSACGERLLMEMGFRSRASSPQGMGKMAVGCLARTPRCTVCVCGIDVYVCVCVCVCARCSCVVRQRRRK